MRNFFLLILLSFVAFNITAQTNTFPTNGNAGVGTVTPQQKLTVLGKITSSAGGNDYYGAWLDGTNSNSLLGLGPWHNQAGYLKWYDNSFPRRLSLYTHNTTDNLTLQEFGGNVGIGTILPSKKLDVWSSANMFTASFGSTLGIGQWSGIHFGYKEEGNEAYKQAGLVFERTAYNTAAPGKIHLLNTTSQNSATLVDAKFTLDEIGRIGVGTQSPKKKLDIWGGANDFTASFGNTIGVGQWSGIHFGYKEDGNDFYKQAGLVFERTDYNNAAPGKIHLLNTVSHYNASLIDSKFTLDEIGRIGVGTQNPKKKLDVWGSANDFIASFGNTIGVGQWSGIHFGYKEDGNDLYKQAGIVFERTGYNTAAPGKIHLLNTTSSQNATLADSKVTIDELGNMGVGTVTPTEKLSVNGNIRAKKIIISQSGWPDYVFDSSYSLRTLSEVENFIINNKHLPDMPSAKEVEENGISLGDHQAILLKKIEELTLYLIHLKKENEKQYLLIKKQGKDIQLLKKKL